MKKAVVISIALILMIGLLLNASFSSGLALAGKGPPMDVPPDIDTPGRDVTLEVLNPVASRVIEPVQPAPRLDTLDGKRILMFFCGKHNGDLFLDRLQEGLETRIVDAEYIRFNQGVIFASLEPEEWAEIEAADPDAVIYSFCA